MPTLTPAMAASLPQVIGALTFMGVLVGGAIGITIRVLVFSDKRMQSLILSAFSSEPFTRAVEKITGEIKQMVADLRARDSERADDVVRAHQRIDALAEKTSKELIDIYKRIGTGV